MRQEVQSALEPFLRSVAAAPRAALLLDYDGTLAPFRARRDQALPYPAVVSVLQEIMRNGRTKTVVISGREASEVPRLLRVEPRPETWGVHGLQRLRADGTEQTLSLNERTHKALSEAERWLEYQQLLDKAELKPGGIAIHWRGLGEYAAEDMRSRILLGWRLIALRSGLQVLEFDGGVEILAPEASKGNAVRTLLEELGPEIPVAYLGDDHSDESAFDAIGERGISVLVRPQFRPTSAGYWLKPPDEVVDFLGMWLRSCTQRRTQEAAQQRR